MSVAPEVIIVPELSLQVATGETCYPDESGFAAHWAEVSTADPNLVRSLSEVARQKRRVLLRCAMLDVIGRVTKQEQANGVSRFIVSVDDLTYRRPGAA
jgi:hypothetical protein